MLARFHVAEEVTQSPFGVQIRPNLDSSLRLESLINELGAPPPVFRELHRAR
jgi:hypothetical protein